MGSILSFRPQIENLTQEFAAEFPRATDVHEDVHEDGRDDAKETLGVLLAELVTSISAYREEGVKTVPLIFLTSHLDALLISLKGNDPVEIGEGPLTPVTIRAILKVCGPLGQNHEWGIYVIPSGEKISYGIFRTDRFPLHETCFQRMRSLRNPKLPIIAIQRIGESIVEIRNASGKYAFIDGSGSLEISQNPSFTILQWVTAVTVAVPENLKRKMESFYYRLAVELLSMPHGSLVAVLAEGEPYPPFLMDGVLLKKSFGLSQAIQRYIKSRDEAATLSLASYGSLIRKMMGMDGITVFNASGDVLAYNCFARELHLRNPSQVIVGGARKRAFDVLCTHLGKELNCALYQSQDGYGQCRISKALQIMIHSKHDRGTKPTEEPNLA